MLIKTPLPFENLLADLQRHGFAIGLDHHLRLQAMLAALDGRCMPSDLKSLLCPIFAASEQQQRLFYSLFDHHFSIFALASPAPPALDPVDTARAEHKTNSERRDNRTPRIVLLLLVAVIASSLFFWLRRAPSTQPQLPPAEAPANIPPEPAPAPAQPDQNGPGPTPQPLATSPAPGPSAVPSQQPATSFPITLILAILLVVIPAAWFLIGEIARWRRRRLVLQRQEGRLPPHSWPMRLQGTGVSLYSSPAFYTAARWLHTRQTGEGMDLDVGGTIDATIRSGGFAAFHYYRRTRLPDYLVLIDRASFRDHQARLFDSLAAALHEEGLFLEQFFYEGDPRECWTQGSDSPLSLIELQRRYPEHRLLLFGDGAALLDPVSGQLAAWTEVFSGWREKAVLSPVATTEWGVRERRLAGQSLVLPATQEGLRALGDYFRSAQSADGSWPGGAGRPAILDTPADLREHLGADAFAWLCACAVYPELHWDLTLHIACLASMPPGLVTEENLLKLVRLPWFRSGFIPDDLRYQLIHELAPGQEREVRSAVIEMLAKTPAPEGTIAADRQRMEIVLQRYFLSRQEGASVRRLRRILEEVPQNLRRHYVALRSTELAVPSPLDFLLPRALRKILFVGGHSLLGMRGLTRLAATLAVIGIGLFSLMTAESSLRNRSNRKEVVATGKIRVEIATTPPGASVLINGETRCTSACTLSLAPGSYQVAAFLDGYEPAASGIAVNPGQPVTVSLTLEPQAQSLRILTDLAQGKVAIDDQPPADLHEGQFILDHVQPRSHSVKITSKTGEASFSFETAGAKLPAIVGAITAKNLSAMVVASSGNQAHLVTNAGPLKLAVNGQPEADAGPEGVDLKGFRAGVDELTLGVGKDQFSVKESFGPAPMLTAFFKSDINIGTLIVSTGEDDVRVFLSNRDVGRRTQRGQLRIQTIGPVSVRVMKDGFESPPAQTAEVKKGEETRLDFKLKASAQFSTLQIAGGTPGAEVLIDQRGLGTVGPEGGFSNGAVAPGDHVIELRRDQYGTRRLQRTFRAGQTVTISGGDAILAANPAPAPAPVIARKEPAPAAAPKVGTMDDWEDPGAWKLADGVWLHQGMGFIPYKLPPNGVFTFTVQLVEGGVIFRGGKIRWVLNYIDNQNYALFELDNKNFWARVVSKGRTTERTHVQLKDLEKQESFTIQIDATPEHIVQRLYSGSAWMNLDAWAERGRNFSEGKFGFLVQGNGEIGLTDFKFQPK